MMFSSLELIEDYHLLHNEVEPIKHLLAGFVIYVLLQIKRDSNWDIDVEEFYSYLRTYLDEDQVVLYIKDSLILESIKEYLYHLFNEMGGKIELAKVDKLVFLGSLSIKPYRAVVDLRLTTPHQDNILLGV